METATLSVWDYLVFGVVLGVSLIIGCYYACKGRNNASVDDFLLASRNMSILPVSMSLLVSFISAVFILGSSSEIYRFGGQYLAMFAGFLFMTPIATHLYHPVYFQMKLSSMFEYLELRFSRGIRMFAAIVYIVQMVLYMTVALYAPSLALNAVTGFNLWAAVFSVGIVCTIYTALGGIKAVMWTDVFQAVLIFAGLMAIIIKGSMINNGFGNIMRILEEGERDNFADFRVDPRVRYTWWSAGIGLGLMWLSVYAANQAQVQRILSLPTKRKVTIAMYVTMVGTCTVMIMGTLCGFVVYAEYAKCDPVLTNRISSYDQILPLYVMDRLSGIKGLPGLIISTLYAGALSTISSGLNAVASVTIEDIMKTSCADKITDQRASRVAKVLILIYGAAMMLLIFVVRESGTVLQVTGSLFGVTGGSTLGLITLGMFYPWVNSKGAGAGFICALICSGWLAIGTIIEKPRGEVAPVSTECPDNMQWMGNTTTTTYQSTPTYLDTTMSDYTAMTASMDSDDGPSGIGAIYTLSFTWYTTVALIVATVVGLLVSLVTGMNNVSDVDPKLLSPMFLRLYCARVDEDKKVTSPAVDEKQNGINNDAFYTSKNDLSSFDQMTKM